MKKPTSSVDYQEPISLKVGGWLMQKDFSLATYTRHPISSPEVDNSVGILTNDPIIKTQKSFLGRTTRKSWRTFLGTIWFKSFNSPKADEENWIFVVCGQNNVELAKTLAEEMAKAFNVKISIVLSHGGPETEFRPDEVRDMPR